jgi:predicted enzyme related to lactoylglutathione lyase
VGERTSYETGTFSWADLSTTDPDAAKRFYAGLFGWELDDTPAGEGMTYTMCRIGGKDACAISAQMQQERDQGIPPHWNSYITVANVDEATARAKELGAQVLAPPFDVMDAGRMAVLQDPTGAVFQVWQPKRHAGAKILREPGSLCWTELATRDTAAAKKFYTSLFGWKEKTSTDAGMTYTEFSVDNTPGAGMMEMNAQMAGVPPHWLPYFQVADCDASANKARELGGVFLVPPSDIPNVGRFSVIRDPQGAAFAIFKPARE